MCDKRHLVGLIGKGWTRKKRSRMWGPERGSGRVPPHTRWLGHDAADESINPTSGPIFRVVRRTRVRDGVGFWQRASYG